MAAHDLRYRAEPTRREFIFSDRSIAVDFGVPLWIQGPLSVFRVDADGTHDVSHTVTKDAISISDTIDVVGIYVATTDEALRSRIDRRHADLIEKENAIPFDPGNNERDRDQLRAYVEE